jgi:hypothetical protein
LRDTDAAKGACADRMPIRAAEGRTAGKALLLGAAVR